MPAYQDFGWLRRNKIKLLKYSDLGKKQQKLVRSENYDEDKYLAIDKRVIQIGAYIDECHPFQDGTDKTLFNRFLRIDLSKNKNVIELIETFGPLQMFLAVPGNNIGYQLVGELIEVQQRLRWRFDLYVGLMSSSESRLEKLLGEKLKSGQPPRETASEIITEAINNELCHVSYPLRAISRVFFETIHYRNFEQVLYLKFKEYILNKQAIKICPGCNEFFFSEGKTEWHDVACKNRFYSARAYEKKKLEQKCKEAFEGFGRDSDEFKSATEELVTWQMQNRFSGKAGKVESLVSEKKGRG